MIGPNSPPTFPLFPLHLLNPHLCPSRLHSWAVPSSHPPTSFVWTPLHCLVFFSLLLFPPLSFLLLKLYEYSPLLWLLCCNWSWKPPDKPLSVRQADRQARWLLLSFNKWAGLEEERRVEGRAEKCSSCFFSCHLWVVCWETCLLSHKNTPTHLLQRETRKGSVRGPYWLWGGQSVRNTYSLCLQLRQEQFQMFVCVWRWEKEEICSFTPLFCCLHASSLFIKSSETVVYWKNKKRHQFITWLTFQTSAECMCVCLWTCGHWRWVDILSYPQQWAMMWFKPHQSLSKWNIFQKKPGSEKDRKSENQDANNMFKESSPWNDANNL